MDPHPTSLITSTPLNQIASVIPFKLRDDNYLVWKSTILPLLKSYNVISFIDGTGFCPPQFVTRVNERNQLVNPAYTLWDEEDQTIILWINSSIGDIVFSHLSGAYALAAAGCVVTDPELVVTILNGIHADYAYFATSIRVRYPPVTSRELHNLLLSEEIVVTDRPNALKLSPEKAFAANTHFQSAPYGYYSAPRVFTPTKSRGHHGRGRGWTPSFTKSYNSFYQPPHPPMYYSPRPQTNPGWKHMPSAQRPPNFATPPASSEIQPCQLCLKIGHLAPTCHQRMNFAYQGRAPPPNLSEMLANMNVFGENPWFEDSGANNHITADEESITINSPYTGGSETISTANGERSFHWEDFVQGTS